MALGRRAKLVIVVAAVILVAAVVGWTLFQSLLAAPVSFVGTLQQVGSVHPVTWGDLSGYFVFLKLTYTSPASLSASGLLLTVHPPPGGTILLPNGTTLAFAELPYHADSYPPWLTSLPGFGTGGPFTATCIDPNGASVTRALPTGFQGATSEVLYSGAVFNVTFGGNNGPVGFTIDVSHDGNPGISGATIV